MRHRYPSEAFAALLRDVKFAVRSLARTKGLTITVVLTLALALPSHQS